MRRIVMFAGLLALCSCVKPKDCAEMCKPRGVFYYHGGTDTCLCQPAPSGDR